MTILLVSLLVASLNTLLGAVVWSACDFEDQRLWKWFRDAPGPEPIKVILQTLVLNAWPVAICVRIKSR